MRAFSRSRSSSVYHRHMHARSGLAVLLGVFGLVVFSAGLSRAQAAEREIRVCVAPVRNVSKRPVSLNIQRARLLRELKNAKPPKKAADQRRIQPIGTESDGFGPEVRERECDFTLEVEIVDVRQPGDAKGVREQADDPFARTPSSSDMQTFAEVRFAIFKPGSLRPLVDYSLRLTERMSEDATVLQLMDRIAQRVNSAVREAPPDRRE